MSWIITCISTGEVFEIFERDNYDKAKNSDLFKIETAAEYLGRINQQIKDESNLYRERMK